MAINSQDRWGPAVAVAIKNFSVGLSTTEFITDDQLKQLWQIITGQHKTELNTNQDIQLLLNDIPVLPGSFQDSTHSPITGLGSSQAVTLTQRTK